jgi:hypothetical protein
MKRLAIAMILASCLTVAFSSCQSWTSSVAVSDRPLFRIYQRAPISSPRRNLPYNDYWYKYQDNYKPPKSK